jgi:hypothetical protein
VSTNELGYDIVMKRAPGLPSRRLADRRSAQAFGILNDPLVAVEQIAALDHVHDAGGIPVQPFERPVGLDEIGQRRDAAVHAVQIHRQNQIGPFERLTRVMDRQGGHRRRIAVAAGQRVVVRRKRLKRFQAGLLQRLGRRHLHALGIDVADPDHRRLNGAEAAKIAFADRAFGQHRRRDPLVEQIVQHLRELRAGRVEGHRIRTNGHHGAGQFLVIHLGA